MDATESFAQTRCRRAETKAVERDQGPADPGAPSAARAGALAARAV